jgi:MFS transporter, DHA1 family, multidrug resistance protein
MKQISKRLVLILGALTAFGSLSIDMYLPSFPTLERDLSASAASVQLSLAAFFVGMSLGQAVYGPLADRYGRKPPLYFGIVLYTLASIGCALAPNVEVLIGFRLLQALGGCTGIVIARAMVRDLFDHQSSAKVFSLLTLVLGAAPILAPSLGGYILTTVGWRAIFVVLAVFGIGCLIAAVWGLKETLPPEARNQHPRPLLNALKTYGELLRDRRFIGYALAGGVAQTGLFAYISNAPFVFIKLYGVSERAFGVFFGCNAFGLIAASQINHRLLARWKSDVILSRVIFLLACWGIALFIVAWTGWGGFWGLVPLLFCYIASLGFSFPNATAGALAHQSHRAGSASALMGTLQFGTATIAGLLVGALHPHSAVPLASVVAGGGLLALFLHRTMVAPLLTQAPSTEPQSCDDPDIEILD